MCPSIDSARCIAFHSEWMERSPEDELVQGALNRRKQFPVAAVVVVHDDISLMRTALEEVALVVEHIVSENGCSGEVRAGLYTTKTTDRVFRLMYGTIMYSPTQSPRLESQLVNRRMGVCTN